MTSTGTARRLRVVIVGAGFAGLECARALKSAPAEVTVIDRANHHLFAPLLYQVATAALSADQIAWPVRHILRRQANVRVVMAEARGVDLDGRRVLTDHGDFPYDRLVIATGTTHAYFGNDEWAEHAPGLKSVADADRLRARIFTAFERAEVEQDLKALARLLTFVVVGGGPTGVETAGALAEVARDALPRDFRRIDPEAARVILVEAGPRILSQLPEHLGDYAVKALEARGVEVRTDARVTGVDARGVDLEGDERIEAATVVWAAGVRASSFVAEVDGPHDKAGRLEPGPHLSLPDRPEVYVAGDAAAATCEDGSPVPNLAPAAKQAGRWIGRRLAAEARGRTPDPAPFRYRHQGDLATIGRDAAVVKFGGVELTGFVAWLFWSVAHVWFLVGLRDRVGVAVTWAHSYLTRRREARLIVEPRA